jgi:hypothetical protein
MRTYTLSKEATAGARQVGVSARIDEKGAYKGKLILAEAVTSKQGTEGIEFRFKADDGRTADYLSVWTHKSNGEELSGNKIIAAMMVCLRVRSIESQRARVKKWDSNTRAEAEVDAMVFPDLMNKPVGLLIYREEYEKNNGDTDWKSAIALPFDHATNRTAGEILDQKPEGEALFKMVELLKDRPLRARKGAAAGGGSSGATGGGSGGRPQTAFDDMDDDIPFASSASSFDMEPRHARRGRRTDCR